MSDPRDPITPADRVRALLRGNSAGELRWDERVDGILYVIDEAGHPAAPVAAPVLEAANTVLSVPRESFDSLEVLVTPEEVPGESAAFDRWRIYHGETDRPRFARLHVEAVRYGTDVFDGDSLVRPNPLAGAEPRLCRWLNKERRDDLRRLTERYCEVAVEQPMAVGVDSYGLDVKARFGIVRVAFDSPIEEEDRARAAIEAMIARAQGETS